MHTIEILEHTETRGTNDSSDLAQEEKLSSSDIRRSMLGSFRQPQVYCFTMHACTCTSSVLNTEFWQGN